ncbi:hypothetical protein FRC00_000388, partial [Tulasnella sp. 408]
FAAFVTLLAEDIRVPTQKEPTTSGTECFIDPDIGGETASSTAVTLDVKATGGTDGSSETSTELTKPIVQPAAKAETAPYAATTYHGHQIPASATWGGGHARNFVLDYNTQMPMSSSSSPVTETSSQSAPTLSIPA